VRFFQPALLTFALLSTLPALAATPITGTVTNATTGKPSAGDTVVLIRLAQGMQESTHTTTDAHGHYSLDVPDEGIHLVRVTHDKANYFQPAPPGTNVVDLDVYNAAAKVKGVSTEADVMRIQSDASGNGLRVVENFFIKNESHPQLTQFSNAPFDFYLPDGAIVEGSAALAPGGMPVQSAPVPLAEKGHYTFLFPIRPGETRFQITYRLPYSGKLTFNPRVTGPVDTIAIMLPKSMTFAPTAGAPYNPVNDEVNAQTYVARNVTPKDPLGFDLSGNGQLPRDTQNPNQASQGNAPAASPAPAQGQADASGPNSAEANTMPGKGLDNPLDPTGNRDPWSKYKYWILAGLALLMAGGAGVLLRKPAVATANAAIPLAPGTSAPKPPTVALSHSSHEHQLLAVLKEELFALETERLQNRISEEAYLHDKAALETVLRRALARTSTAQNPSATGV
jgi:hypothetical protein